MKRSKTRYGVTSSFDRIEITRVTHDGDSGGSSDLDERVFVQHDANFNVTAIISTSGAVLERYVYDPYGGRTIKNSSWSANQNPPFGSYSWVHFFQGSRFDNTTSEYDFRHRVYSATLGRPLQADPLGYPDGTNRFEWEGSNPASQLDPSGLTEKLLPDRDLGGGFGGVYIPPMGGYSPESTASPFPPGAGEVVVGIIGIVFEPVDTGMTIVEIVRDPGNPWSYCGLLPLVPSGVGKAAKKVVGVSAGGLPIDQFGRPLGPSGKPFKNSRIQCPSRKRAKDAARNDGIRAPEHNPSDQHASPPHFHPTDEKGDRIPSRPHYDYPRK